MALIFFKLRVRLMKIPILGTSFDSGLDSIISYQEDLAHVNFGQECVGGETNEKTIYLTNSYY